MQDTNKVKIVDADPATREKVKIYLSTLKLNHCTLNGKRIRTMEDAILFSMEQAERVPELEKRINELENEKVET